MSLADLYPLTFAGTGMEEAEARIGLAHIMLGDLVDGFRERLDGQRDLADRVREINEVLVSAVRVAAVDPSGGADGGLDEADRVLLAHDDSPSVGGPDTSTVGAPGGVAPVASPGT